MTARTLRLLIFVCSVAAAGCSALPSRDATVIAAPAVSVASHDMAQLRAALEEERPEALRRQREIASIMVRPSPERPGSLPGPDRQAILSSLMIPVVGLGPSELHDSFGAPRDGGRRRHRGIDIFAPKGRQIVAVTDGTITYVGVQPKGGNCLWLATDAGVSFYYAHLDRFAPGLHTGQRVSAGDLLGFVGNTGNAVSTPPHLHFVISLDGNDVLNPYPVLRRASRATLRPLLTSGALGGNQ